MGSTARDCTTGTPRPSPECAGRMRGVPHSRLAIDRAYRAFRVRSRRARSGRGVRGGAGARHAVRFAPGVNCAGANLRRRSASHPSSSLSSLTMPTPIVPAHLFPRRTFAKPFARHACTDEHNNLTVNPRVLALVSECLVLPDIPASVRVAACDALRAFATAHGATPSHVDLASDPRGGRVAGDEASLGANLAAAARRSDPFVARFSPTKSSPASAAAPRHDVRAASLTRSPSGTRASSSRSRKHFSSCRITTRTRSTSRTRVCSTRWRLRSAILPWFVPLRASSLSRRSSCGTFSRQHPRRKRCGVRLRTRAGSARHSAISSPPSRAAGMAMRIRS